jgi:hypothetical protein
MKWTPIAGGNRTMQRLKQKGDNAMSDNTWSWFGAIDNMDGTFRIECEFTVYFAEFKHYPDWLGYKPTDEDLKFGVPTRFWFLVEDDLPPNKVNDRLTFYRNKYDTLIPELENDDTRWDEFPFKDIEEHYITYSK